MLYYSKRDVTIMATRNTTMKITVLFVILTVSMLSGCIDNESTTTVKTTKIVTVPDVNESVIVSVPETEVSVTEQGNKPVTPTVMPTAVPTVMPTPIKNAEPIRGSYVSQMGNFFDDAFCVIITRGQYRDVEFEAEMDAYGAQHRAQYSYCVHPDLKSYNVYVNGELYASYPAPENEDFSDVHVATFYPRITPEDYPITVTIETEYMDGEIFKTTITDRASQGERPYSGGHHTPTECEWV